MTVSERYDDECSNHGWNEKWTRPGCYEDFSEKEECVATCSRCGRKSELSLESQPVCVAVILEDEAP